MASNNTGVTSKDKKQESEYDSSWLKGTSAEKDIQVKKNDFSNPVFSKLSRINGKINSMSMDELRKSLEEVQLETKFEFFIFPFFLLVRIQTLQ